MRIFLDANVLVAIVNREYPAFTPCAKIISLADRSGFNIVSSSLSIAITWYFAAKKHGENLARKKLEILLKHVIIAPCGPEEVELAIKQQNAHDFEDALQYFSALGADCDHIVSSNAPDFYFANIPVSDPETFFRYVY